MSAERRMGIIEQEMRGMRKEIPIVETYNMYGDAARTVEIEALEEHVDLVRILEFGIPKWRIINRWNICVYYGEQAFESCSRKNGSIY